MAEHTYIIAIQAGLRALQDYDSCIEELVAEVKQLGQSLQQATDEKVTAVLLKAKVATSGRVIKLIDMHGKGQVVFVLDLADGGYPVSVSVVLSDTGKSYGSEGSVLTVREAQPCKHIGEVINILCEHLRTTLLAHTIEDLRGPDEPREV